MEEKQRFGKKCGPGTYAQVAETIARHGLDQPTMADTASLAHRAFGLNGGIPNPPKWAIFKTRRDKSYCWIVCIKLFD